MGHGPRRRDGSDAARLDRPGDDLADRRLHRRVPGGPAAQRRSAGARLQLRRLRVSPPCGRGRPAARGPDKHEVLGVIETRGRVEVHEAGIRAEHADIVALLVEVSAGEEYLAQASRAAATYGAELVPLNGAEQFKRYLREEVRGLDQGYVERLLADSLRHQFEPRASGYISRRGQPVGGFGYVLRDRPVVPKRFQNRVNTYSPSIDVIRVVGCPLSGAGAAGRFLRSGTCPGADPGAGQPARPERRRRLGRLSRPPRGLRAARDRPQDRLAPRRGADRGGAEHVAVARPAKRAPYRPAHRGLRRASPRVHRCGAARAR